MDKKAIAKMLFKMHLKKGTRRDLDYYFTDDFAETIMVAVPDMNNLEKIGRYWPDHEFMILFEDDTLIFFDTEGGDRMRPFEIADERAKDEALDAARNVEWTEWYETDQVRIDGATIWMRAL